MNKSIWVKGSVFVFFVFMQMNTGFLSAQTSKNSLYKQTSEMADMMIQYDADKGSVTRFYASSSSQENRFSRPDAGVGYNSPERRERFLALIADYQKQMLKLDFNSFDINGKVDYILFKRNLEDQAYQLNEEQEKYVKIAKYLPFENRIYALEKVRRRGLSVVGQEVAKELNDLNKEILKSISGVKKMDSVEMVFTINNVIVKDTVIAAQQTHIEALRQEINSNGNELVALQKIIDLLEQEVKGKEKDITTLQNEFFATRKGPADRILIEKRERRLSLISKGKVLKTYHIALGGNPIGPKEKQGDNKTPEGTYIIDARNKNSRYHLSLHISYPNEKDKKRAKERGVSPGGDIMIHGIKNGFSWVGDLHTEVDWTKGCIAVTDEEIEEIDKLAPNGTIVEIRP